MNCACLFLASMAAYSQAADNSAQRGLASLAEKWNITDPTFEYDALSFDLTSTVSEVGISVVRVKSADSSGLRPNRERNLSTSQLIICSTNY